MKVWAKNVQVLSRNDWFAKFHVESQVQYQVLENTYNLFTSNTLGKSIEIVLWSCHKKLILNLIHKYLIA